MSTAKFKTLRRKLQRIANSEDSPDPKQTQAIVGETLEYFLEEYKPLAELVELLETIYWEHGKRVFGRQQVPATAEQLRHVHGLIRWCYCATPDR